MLNPKIRLHPWLLKQAETFGPPRPLTVTEKDEDAVFLPTLLLTSLAKMPDFIRYPKDHLFAIQQMYERKRFDIPKMQRRLAKKMLPPPHVVGMYLPPVPQTTLIYLYYVAYALLLALALIINGLLRALDPSDELLVAESIAWSSEVMVMAERMSPYRPLGSGYMPVCLLAAWAATADLSQHPRIEKLLAEYQTDFEGARWMDGAIWLKNRYVLLSLQSLATRLQSTQEEASPEKASTEEDSRCPVDPGKLCCIQ